MDSPAARTNLSSVNVRVNRNVVIGTGQFRIAYAGTYLGGNRNQQEAVCKQFRSKYSVLENEFYQSDFKVTERAIAFAEDWNDMCESGREILITYGTIHRSNGERYLVEPLIRYFEKFTSNNGWIAHVDDVGWAVLAIEAFSHYSYHRSGGQMIVCDLQGRYRYDRNRKNRCRFELTDPAICSRRRNYGITDLGEKGIETFFARHVCNRFCNWDGYWSRPNRTSCWFESTPSSSMIASSYSHLLSTQNPARFTRTLTTVYDEDDDDDSGDY